MRFSWIKKPFLGVAVTLLFVMPWKAGISAPAQRPVTNLENSTLATTPGISEMPMMPMMPMIPMIPMVAYATPAVWTKHGYMEFDLGRLKVSDDNTSAHGTVENFWAGVPVGEGVQGVVSSSLYQSDIKQTGGFNGSVHEVVGSFGFAWRAHQNWYVGIAGRHEGFSASGELEINQLSVLPISGKASTVVPEVGGHFQNGQLQLTFGHRNLPKGTGGSQHLRSRWWIKSDIYLCAGGDYKNGSDKDSKQAKTGALMGLGYNDGSLNGEFLYEAVAIKERETSASGKSERTESTKFQVNTRYRISPKISIGLIVAAAKEKTTAGSAVAPETTSIAKNQAVSLAWGWVI